MTTLVRRIDAVTLLRADAPQVTGEGFRLYDALFARTGIQVYDDGRGGTIREYRPDAEVFDGAAIGSYELRPLTDLHPPGNVTTDTAKVFARGAVSGARRHEDGRHVAGRLAVWDSDLLAKFDEAEARGDAMQLSAGYTLSLDPTPGVTADGQRYDAIQRAIRINHVAAVPLGRAGTARVLTDAADLVGAIDLGIAQRLDAIRPTSRVIFDLGRWARRDAADLRTQTTSPPAKEPIPMDKIVTSIAGQPVEIIVADGGDAKAVAAALASDMFPLAKKKKGEEDPDEEEEDGKVKKDAADHLAAEKARADAAEKDAAQARAEAQRAIDMADVLSVGRVLIGLDYKRADSVDGMRLDVIAHALGDAERKAIEALDDASRPGAIAYAYGKAVQAAKAKPAHADNLLDQIRKATKSDAGEVEDSYAKARRDAAARAANPSTRQEG